ncbi:MAG: tetratricopeptide repeat protein [Bacteroidales bacterium]|jgi:tetratricopeptide (TPR) repeat protein
MKKLIFLIFFCFTCTFIQAQDQARQAAEDNVNSGNIKASQKNYTGAISDYNTAIELDPKYGMAYFFRGAAKAQTSDYKGAIADFDKATEINPKHGLAYFYRGVAKMSVGNKDGACSDWNKASDLGTNSANEYIKDYCN